jgi:hypothetical protein
MINGAKRGGWGFVGAGLKPAHLLLRTLCVIASGAKQPEFNEVNPEISLYSA